MDERDLLFNPSDFFSIDLITYFKNLVAGNEAWGADKVVLDEILDHVLILRVPQNSGRTEHQVLIKIARGDVSNQPVIFEATGKILGIERLDDDQLRVAIGLVQYDEDSWNQFVGLFSKRQEEITSFLKQVRGVKVMTAEDSAREAEFVAKFLSTRKVLIADPSTSIRSSLFAVFRELGAQTNLTLLVNSFPQAQATIVSDKPHIIVAEYDLGKRCGLELLQTQRQQRPEETKECLFVIVTSNSSQTAVARSAEEDIDAYIIKPFTPDTVRKTLLRAAVEKVRPRPYIQTIEEGKKLLTEGNYEAAEAQFQLAMNQDTSPSLAYYYLGQTKYMREIMTEAQSSYNKGLSYNRIHYKCLIGLYDLLMKQREHAAAYEVVRRVSQYFPANPKRLAEVLRLAIVTGKYEDIERYYTIFTNIDERDEMLIKYVCAALVVCGKYYLSTKLANARALELFRKASATAQGRTKILREIVQALLEYRLVNEAKTFLTRFPPEACDSDDFLLLSFLISCQSDGGRAAYDQGNALISKNIVDEHLYVAMIKASLASGYVPRAQELVDKAGALFPEKRSFFEEVFNKARALG